jgi:hypothetical protein
MLLALGLLGKPYSLVCLSSIILSPLNGKVKMSPYETGDIHVESEGTATSERYFAMCARQSARAAELLELSPRHIKRLKARYRQGSAAALAHVSRGRPSHRRLPERTRVSILALARTRYTGFNDHHLHDKLVEQEGFSLSRETLRRLPRVHGIARFTS